MIETSGSGKTTFSRELASILGLPCYEMDQMYWKPNWPPASGEELIQLVRDVTSRQNWLLDGNYTQEEIWQGQRIVNPCRSRFWTGTPSFGGQ